MEFYVAAKATWVQKSFAVPFYVQTSLYEVKMRTASILLLTAGILLSIYFANPSSLTRRTLCPEWLANLMLPLFLTSLKLSHQTLLWERCMQVCGSCAVNDPMLMTFLCNPIVRNAEYDRNFFFSVWIAVVRRKENLGWTCAMCEKASNPSKFGTMS